MRASIRTLRERCSDLYLVSLQNIAASRSGFETYNDCRLGDEPLDNRVAFALAAHTACNGSRKSKFDAHPFRGPGKAQTSYDCSKGTSRTIKFTCLADGIGPHQSAEGLRLLWRSRKTGLATSRPMNPVAKTSQSSFHASRSCWRKQRSARAAQEGVFVRHTKPVTPAALAPRQARRQGGSQARQQCRSGNTNPFILSDTSLRSDPAKVKSKREAEPSADDLCIPIVQLDIFASEPSPPSAEDAVAKETVTRAIRGGERKHGRKNVANII